MPLQMQDLLDYVLSKSLQNAKTRSHTMDKITVHTPNGDVSIGDECEFVDDSYNTHAFCLHGTLDGYSKAKAVYSVKITDLDGPKIMYTSKIRPIQKPKPLEGIEQARKLGELFRAGWECSSCDDSTVYINARIYESNGIVEVNGISISKLVIRLPQPKNSPSRSTEWIRACDVTEETGNV